VVSVLRAKIPGLILVPPVGDKVARAQSWQPYVASGNVILPCTCGQSEPHHHEVAASALPAEPWVREFVAEHASFPKGTLKDQVDATSYLIKPLLEGGPHEDWGVDVY
jgi:phage terminase large subunit-like protein